MPRPALAPSFKGANSVHAQCPPSRWAGCPGLEAGARPRPAARAPLLSVPPAKRVLTAHVQAQLALQRPARQQAACLPPPAAATRHGRLCSLLVERASLPLPADGPAGGRFAYNRAVQHDSAAAVRLPQLPGRHCCSPPSSARWPSPPLLLCCSRHPSLSPLRGLKLTLTLIVALLGNAVT